MSTPIKQPVVWFVGLSGAGKSTIADLVAEKLTATNRSVFRLDGDVLRTGLCEDLGYTVSDRAENNRRAAEVARILSDAGTIVLASFMAPAESTREDIKRRVGNDRFLLVHVDCPLTVCEDRDVKGLYKQFRNKEITNFIGLDIPFEPPAFADVTVKTHEDTLESCAEAVHRVILEYLDRTE